MLTIVLLLCSFSMENNSLDNIRIVRIKSIAIECEFLLYRHKFLKSVVCQFLISLWEPDGVVLAVEFPQCEEDLVAAL